MPKNTTIWSNHKAVSGSILSDDQAGATIGIPFADASFVADAISRIHSEFAINDDGSIAFAYSRYQELD